MRVLMVIDSLVGAGAQKQFTNLAVGLSRRKHEVIVYIYHPKYDFLPELEAESIEIVFGEKAGRFDTSPLIQLYKLCRLTRPSVVVSYLRTPSFYAELIRLVYPKFGLIVSERSNALNGRLSIGDLASGICHSVADHVTSNCNDYRIHLVAKLPFIRKKMSVIYNGTDDVYFSAYRRMQAEVNSDHRTRFLVVSARCEHNKGALVLAEALRLVALSDRKDWEVSWVGRVDFDSDYVKSVVGFLALHGLTDHWDWSGQSSSVVSQFPHYDALVSPSLHEGVSNVMCEAMAAGLPVIVTNVSDNNDILVGGRYGLLCAADDDKALCQKLIQFMNTSAGERLALSERAHLRAKELFSFDRYIDEWEQLCKSVAVK